MTEKLVFSLLPTISFVFYSIVFASNPKDNLRLENSSPQGIPCGIAASFILLKLQGIESTLIDELVQICPKKSLSLRDIQELLRMKGLACTWIKSTDIPTEICGPIVGLVQNGIVPDGHYVVLAHKKNPQENWTVFDSNFDRPIQVSSVEIKKQSSSGYWLVNSSEVANPLWSWHSLPLMIMIVTGVVVVFRKIILRSNLSSRSLPLTLLLVIVLMPGCKQTTADSIDMAQSESDSIQTDSYGSKAIDSNVSTVQEPIDVPAINVEGDHLKEVLFFVDFANQGSVTVSKNDCSGEGSYCTLVAFDHVEPDEIAPGEMGKAFFRVKSVQLGGEQLATWKLWIKTSEDKVRRELQGPVKVNFPRLSNRIVKEGDRNVGVVSQNAKSLSIDLSLKVFGRSDSLKPEKLAIFCALENVQIIRHEDLAETSPYASGDKYYLPYTVKIPLASLPPGPFETLVRLEFDDTSCEQKIFGTVSPPWVINGKPEISVLLLGSNWLPNDFIVRNLDSESFKLMRVEVLGVPQIHVKLINEKQFSFELVEPLSESQKQSLAIGAKLDFQVAHDSGKKAEFEFPVRLQIKGR